jgi:hypothetical protein
MEGVSLEIMKQLDHQTNQMKDIGVKINDMNSSLDKSKSLLATMLNRQNRNKTMIVAFVTIIVSILVFVLLIKFLH